MTFLPGFLRTSVMSFRMYEDERPWHLSATSSGVVLRQWMSIDRLSGVNSIAGHIRSPSRLYPGMGMDVFSNGFCILPV